MGEDSREISIQAFREVDEWLDAALSGLFEPALAEVASQLLEAVHEAISCHQGLVVLQHLIQASPGFSIGRFALLRSSSHLALLMSLRASLS